MAEKGVRNPNVFSVRALLAAGVDADVAHQQVHQPIVIVVKEHGSGGMRDAVDSRILRDVFEMAMAIVLEEDISLIDCRHKQILMT